LEGHGPVTLQSLQKIISLEDELYQAEQAEQDKAVTWLQEQEAEILRHCEAQLKTLDEKKEEARARAAEQAREKATALLQKAQLLADSLDRLDDAELLSHLNTIRAFITGQTP